MRDLIDKIEQLRKSLAVMKPKQDVLTPALKLPSIKPLSMPTSSSGPVKPKLPGVAPVSGKDPVKMAQQLKNPRPTKPKVEVLKTDKNGQWSLEKAVPDFRQPKKISFDRPQIDESNPLNIHADRHGFGGNMNLAHPGQKDLIHGINMGSGTSVDQDTATKGNKWIHNSLNGKHMIVKPSSGAEFGDPKMQDAMGHRAPDALNAARREVLSHNLARDTGLGSYFPTTAGFTHKGDDYSAQEKMPGSQVRDIRRDEGHKDRKHLENTVKHMHSTGDLHKLAIFDALMGNNDRHLGNMILDPSEKKIHHIDSGRAVDYASTRPSDPSGLLKLAGDYDLPHTLHPKTKEWLDNLDEKGITDKIDKYVEGDSKFKKNFLDRLHNLKTILHGKPDSKLSDVITNLSKIKRSGSGRVGSNMFDSTVKKSNK